MNRNQILKIYGTDYKEMTKRLLASAELDRHLLWAASQKAGKGFSSGDRAAGAVSGAEEDGSLVSAEDKKALRIAIKPNLVCATPASFGGTTHPEIVAGIIEYLREHGYSDIRIIEGSWVGDKTSDAFEYCGYRELTEHYHVPFIDGQKEKSHPVDAAGMELHVVNAVDEIDFLINVPVLKGHCQTKVTCALKNMKGLLPNSEKRRFHKLGLHRPIAHLSTVLKPDFIVIDHICGDLDFEEGGNPVVRNCVMAALDPVLTDTYACWLMHYTPDDVPYVRMSEKLGSGSTDLSSAQIIELNRSAEGGTTDEELPQQKKLLAVSYAVDEVDSCSACYGNLIPALYRLKEEGLLDGLQDKIAIGQGQQGKSGPLGIGKCTRGFSCCIMGCPPSEDVIYEGLKAYIRGQRNI